jgi:hypothetical protein
MELTIQNSLSFLRKLEKLPMKEFVKDYLPTTQDEEIYWIGSAPLDDIKFINKVGAVKIGVENLIRRYNNLEIPGMVVGKKGNKWPGGTEAWFEYLYNENRLQPLNYNMIYPKGTLILQEGNIIDEGDILITIDNHKLGILETNIIYNINYSETLGLKTEKFKCHNQFERFTHICLPEDWILRN